MDDKFSTIAAQMSPGEKKYYDEAFKHCSQDGHYVDVNKIKGFMSHNTQLRGKQLKEIWQKCISLGQETLNKQQFYAMLRFVGMTQENVPTADQDSFVLSRAFRHLPTIKELQKPIIFYGFPSISPQDLANYEDAINNVDCVLTNSDEEKILDLVKLQRLLKSLA